MATTRMNSTSIYNKSREIKKYIHVNVCISIIRAKGRQLSQGVGVTHGQSDQMPGKTSCRTRQLKWQEERAFQKKERHEPKHRTMKYRAWRKLCAVAPAKNERREG